MTNGVAGEQAEVNVGQKLRNTPATIVGVKAGVINGNVTVHQTEVQVYALTPEERGNVWNFRVYPGVSPYPGPAAFTFEQRVFFYGRHDEAMALIRNLDSNNVVLVHGPAASGKTSLINSVLVPVYLERGALVVRMEDYGDPAATLVGALEAAGSALSLNLEGRLSFAEQAAQVVGQGEGSLLIVLDQVERIFAMPDDQRDRALAAVGELLQRAGPLLRVVVVYSESEDEAFADLTSIGTGELLSRPVHVGLLSTEGAREAIKEPARVHGGITFVSDGLIAGIVSDLAELSAVAPGLVEPIDLQIVAATLFDEARRRADAGGFPDITEDSYAGAEEIVAQHLSQSLANRYGDKPTLTLTVLQELSQPGPHAWVAPSEVPAPESRRGEVRDLLERMCADGFVARRTADPYEYTLANPSMRTAVERYTGTAGAKRVAQVADGLWHGWLTHRRLADVEQLEFLAAAAYRPQRSPVKVLLLRSAAATRVGIAGWLRELADNRALVDLEESGRVPPKSSPFHALFGLGGLGEGDITPGPLSAAAVLLEDATSADVAALGLSTVDEYPERIRTALHRIDGSRRRRARRARVWGVLREAGVGEDVVADMGQADQFAVWINRVVRRSTAHRSEIGWETLGAAVGGGLAFGVFRLLTSFWTSIPKGVDLSVNFFWAFLLMAGAAGFVVGAGRILMKPTWWKLLSAGAVGFGGAHVVVTLLNGQSPTSLYWSTSLAFVAGISIAALLLRTDIQWSWWAWLAGGLGVAAVFGVLHAVIQESAPPISADGPVRESMQLVRNASFYAAELPRHFNELASRDFSWFKALSVFDAAVAGASVAMGARGGARLVHRRRHEKTEQEEGQ